MNHKTKHGKEDLRNELAIWENTLDEFYSPKIAIPYTTQNNAHITEILDTLKHRLSVKAQWLGRYEEANGRKQLNRLYSTSEKRTIAT